MQSPRIHSEMSGANRLPGCVSVLAHVDGSGDVVAVHGAFEGPCDDVSRDRHGAVEFDLVCVNAALEGGVIDLAGLGASEIVAVLLEGELLLAGTARIVDGDGPSAVDFAG